MTLKLQSLAIKYFVLSDLANIMCMYPHKEIALTSAWRAFRTGFLFYMPFVLPKFEHEKSWNTGKVTAFVCMCEGQVCHYMTKYLWNDFLIILSVKTLLTAYGVPFYPTFVFSALAFICKNIFDWQFFAETLPR